MTMEASLRRAMVIVVSILWNLICCLIHLLCHLGNHEENTQL